MNGQVNGQVNNGQVNGQVNGHHANGMARPSLDGTKFDARSLSETIKNATSTDTLLHLVSEHANEMTPFNIQHCLTKFASLSRPLSESERASLVASPHFSELVSLTFDCKADLTPRHVASVVHALAVLRVRDVRLLRALTERVVACTDKFNNVDCALLLYAYAVLKVQPGSFIDDLATQFFTVANGGPLIHKGGNKKRTTTTMTDTSSSSSPSTSSSTSSSSLPPLLDTCKPQDVSMVLWSMAKMNRPLLDLEPAAIALTERLVPHMTQQGVANVLWAMANMDMYDAGVVTAAASRATLLLESSLAAPPLSNARSSATYVHGNELSNIIWSLSRFGHLDASLFALADRAMVQGQVKHLQAMDWASVLYSLAAIGHRPSEAFLKQCQGMLAERANLLTTQDVLCVGWGLAVLGALPAEVGSKTLQEVAARSGRMQKEEEEDEVEEQGEGEGEASTSSSSPPPPPPPPSPAHPPLEDRALRMALHIQLLAREAGLDIGMDESFRQVCVTSWMKAMFGREPTRGAKSIARTLSIMGVRTDLNFATEDGIMAVEVAVRLYDKQPEGGGAGGGGGGGVVEMDMGGEGDDLEGEVEEDQVEERADALARRAAARASARVTGELEMPDTLLASSSPTPTPTPTINPSSSSSLTSYPPPSRPVVRRRIAFEYLGRYAYLANQPKVLQGRAKARIDMIKSRGWQVVIIPMAEWMALESRRARVEYLGAALDKLGCSGVHHMPSEEDMGEKKGEVLSETEGDDPAEEDEKDDFL